MLVRIAAWQRILKFCAQIAAAQRKFEIKFYVLIATQYFLPLLNFRQDFIATKLHTAKFRTVKFQSKFYGEISALRILKIAAKSV